MIRELVMFALRVIIATSIIGIGAQVAMAGRVEVRCQPIIVPDLRCDAPSAHYNRVRPECRGA